MEQLVDKIFEINLEDIENFNFPYDELFGLKIVHNFETYCFLIRFTHSDKLICLGSGAEKRNEKNFDRPIFQRHTWYSEFNASVIYYSDPIFLRSRTAKCGWCVGTPHEYYLDYIKKILQKLCLNKQIKNKNILFYGSSAGGFTSIKLGTYFKGSKVLVNNPQIDVRNYNDEYYDKLLKVCFRNMAKEDVENEFSDRLNVFSSFKEEKYIPKIHYLLELYSDVDFENNLLPFLREIKKLNIDNSINPIQILIYNENGFHTPLNKATTIKLINDLSNNLTISLNNVQDIELGDHVRFSVPDNFINDNLKSSNKLKFISDEGKSIFIHEYATNKDLSERNFISKLNSLKSEIDSSLLFDEIIDSKGITLYKIRVKENKIRTYFFFEKFKKSYLMVFNNFKDENYEAKIANEIISEMKMQVYIN
ncbi:hypothetical protein [Methanobrevibacter sp.]|uniref:hypothetical protein n=1 Tax=Methanobrevibacter sp. TaxID=66852 RepID=UPI00386ABDCF